MKWFIVDTLLMILFTLQHTVLTFGKVRDRLTRVARPEFWNAIMSATSVVVLVIAYVFWLGSDVVIYRLTGAAYYAVLALSAFGFFAFFCSFRWTTSFAQWLGVSQVYRAITGRPQLGYYELHDQGLKRYVRFPHHASLLIIFWSQPVMTLDTLWLAIFASAYTYMGSVHQDTRGLRYLGDVYAKYMTRSNLLIPNPIQIASDILARRRGAAADGLVSSPEARRSHG